MKEINEIIRLSNALTYDGGWEQRVKAEDAIHAKIKALQKQVGAGVVVGKLLKFSVADGYALYLITKVLKSTVQVVHLPLGDAWHFQGVYENNSGVLCLNRKVAEKTIKWHEGLEALFGQKEFEPLSKIA